MPDRSGGALLLTPIDSGNPLFTLRLLIDKSYVSIAYFNNCAIIAFMNSTMAIRALAALAQEHRLAIFRLLVKQGSAGMPAGEIGERVGISPTSASFHLKELDRAGLISARRDGRFIRYAFSAEAMRDLLGFLMEDCCQGRPELCGDLLTQTRCGSCEEVVDE